MKYYLLQLDRRKMFWLLCLQRLMKYFKCQRKDYCKLFTLPVHAEIIGLGLVCSGVICKAQTTGADLVSNFVQYFVQGIEYHFCDFNDTDLPILLQSRNGKSWYNKSQHFTCFISPLSTSEKQKRLLTCTCPTACYHSAAMNRQLMKTWSPSLIPTRQS